MIRLSVCSRALRRFRARPPDVSRCNPKRLDRRDGDRQSRCAISSLVTNPSLAICGLPMQVQLASNRTTSQTCSYSTRSQPSDSECDGRAIALRVTWWGCGANIGLAILKYGSGVLSGSSALVADAAHSLSDLVSDVITLFVVQYARAPPDDNHPYGHGRFEALGSLAVSATLVGTAAHIGWDAGSQLIHAFGSDAVENTVMSSGFGGIALFACTASLLTKEALYHVTIRAGREVNSQTLIANAWHHRSDAFSSVAALIGVGGCLAGYPSLDPISGLLVSGLVAKAGAEIGWASVLEVTEYVDPEDDVFNEIKGIVQATEGVMGITRLRTRKMGPYSMVDLHVFVDPKISVSAAHHVAECVRVSIIKSQLDISEALVHIEPFELADVDVTMQPHTEVERIVRKTLEEVPEIRGVAHILTHYVPRDGIHLKVDILLDDDITVRRAREIAQKANKILYNVPNVSVVDVDLELAGT